MTEQREEPYVYVTSKARHAPMWRALRSAGLPINSTWIDEAGEGETVSWASLWQRCIAEAHTASILIAYYEDGEEWKGAFVEIGAHLASKGAYVLLVGDPPGSWKDSTSVHRVPSLDAAVDWVMGN